MAGAGITDRNITNILSSKVSSSIVNRKSIDKTSTETPIDLSNPGNRLPGSKNISPSEKIEREKSSLTGRFNSEFPSDLQEHAAAWVQLSFERYSRENAFTPGTISNAGSILLPLPENYNQNFSVSYSPQNQGVLGDLLGSPQENTQMRETLMKMKDGGLTFGAGLRSIAGNVGNRTGAVGLRSLFGSISALGSMADIIPGIDAGSSAVDVLGSVIGAIPNPHSTIFFKGVSLRDFTWTWRLVPRSAKEAQTIREIIAKLRNHILPRKGALNSLEYPDLLQPIVKVQRDEDGPLVDLGEFKKCMVSSMTINYSAEGASAFFRDGHPVAIQLGLSFQEVEIQTSDERGDRIQSGIDTVAESRVGQAVQRLLPGGG